MRVSRLFLAALAVVLPLLGHARTSARQTVFEYNMDLEAWQPADPRTLQFPAEEAAPALTLAESDLDGVAACDGRDCTAGLRPSRRSGRRRSSRGESKATWHEPRQGSYSLSAIHGRSVFAVAPTTHRVMEHFWNERQFVFVRHDNPLTKSTVSVTSSAGRVYSVNRAGRLFERRWSGSSLEWIEVSLAAYSIRGAARASARGDDSCLFFVSRSGELMERCGFGDDGKWTVHGHPKGTLFRAVADAHTVRPASVFLITSAGRLVEWSAIPDSTDGAITRRWMVHGIPDDTLSPTEAAALPGAGGQGSLFMRSDTGSLIERRWTGSSWQWVKHGKPAGEDVVVASPPAPFGGRSVFVVGSDGAAHELFVQSGRWTWIKHGQPSGQPLARSRPVEFDGDTMYFMLDDGRLAARHWDATASSWSWLIHDVPEGGRATYCSTNPHAEDSCMPQTAGKPRQ